MENEEPETKEECMKAFYRILPKEMLEYWKKTLYVSDHEEWGYQVGFVVGVKYVIEKILQPHLDRVDEHLNGKDSVH